MITVTSTSLFVLACLLQLISCKAFVFRTNPEDSVGYWGTGLSILDERYGNNQRQKQQQQQQVLVSGTTFSKAITAVSTTSTTSSSTASNQQDKVPSCFISIGSGLFFSRSIIPEPSICLLNPTFLTNTNEQQDTDTATFGSLVGMQLASPSDDQAIIRPIVLSPGQVEATSSSPLLFPQETFPSVSISSSSSSSSDQATDAPQDTSLYVALHKSSSNLSDYIGGDGDVDGDLQSLLSYWREHTDPHYLTKPQRPEIVRKDGLTGAVDWTTVLDPSSTTTMDNGFGQDLSSSAVISDMLVVHQNDLLVVAGSTNSIYSKDFFGERSNNNEEDSDDWDGYIAFLSTTTGLPIEDTTAIRVESIGQTSSPSFTDSQQHPKDFIHGLCKDLDAPDDEFLYAVGSTTGTLIGIHNGGSFLLKIEINTRQIVWRYQLAGLGIEGHKCLVGDGKIYLAGATEVDVWTNMVHGGNNYVPLSSPQAYVASISEANGQANWIRPLDTEPAGDAAREELIADMQFNQDGDILILLNSMNLQDGTNDMYLLDMDSETGDNDFRSRQGTQNGPGQEEDIIVGDFHHEDSIFTESANWGTIILVIGLLLPFILAAIIFGRTKGNSSKQVVIEDEGTGEISHTCSSSEEFPRAELL